MLVRQLLLLLILIVISVVGGAYVDAGASPFIVWGSVTVAAALWMFIRRKTIFRSTADLEGICVGLMLTKGIMELSYLLGAMAGVSKGVIVGGYLVLLLILGVYIFRKK